MNSIRHYITYLLALIFVFLGLVDGIAQDSLPTVKILSRVQKNQILLRWAVDDAVAWQKTNTSGFILEKYLFSKDGKRLSQPQKIWQKPIKADLLETWQEIVEKDNYAAIIAQALYGESFLIEGSQGELADIVNLSQEIEQRFSFALLAADMSFEAATKAGWGYTDTDVKPNERYVYKIKSAQPQDQLAIKSTSVLAGLSAYEPLPAPIDLQGVFGDKNVILTWEYELFKSIYTSYNLERSEDNKTFIPLSNEPLVNLNDKPNAPAKRMYYIDSLAQNNKTYYYRVNGISPFGEYGTYSDTISGGGQPILPFTPKIRDFKFTKNPNEAIIIWEFPKEGEAITAKFQLNHAEKDAGPYKVVVDNIPPTQRELIYSELEPSNYFTITAVGKTPKQQKTSFSTLIQPIDSMPPAIPTALEGHIDSLGIARFNWKQNEEKDILGYRIFRGFTEKEEPSQLTVSPIVSNEFVDTVEVKNLNSKVYYQVVAVDKRFNHSDKSEVLVLEKPDVIPPTAPVFSNYNVEQSKIKLTWINSSEEEAIHVLSRKNMTDNSEWQDIYKVTDTIQQFTDDTVDTNKTYRYRIRAIDNSGLESLPSTPLTIHVINLTPPDLIKEINFNVYREDNYIELFWRANDNNIAEYTIYKQENEKDPTTWRIVPVNIKRLVDKTVNPNQVYTYHFRATLSNGKFSIVKKVVVKF
ncbi:hypothetical protein VOI54_14325 [Tamlana sp. 2201CG12-4]|uniref:fibronectin type III domain-containing protein n=1 Tax=Tamlana sp. 2201CG12-4 TaxID=3112582 RepID=UPI002DBF86F1|nr:hypothetical protein [Tamlana sp. 2201CG12-4]MEC3908203.1 hypothetical protein [Tamlana sp. 2201CG12-4]